ncbi:hypothetical protein ACJX0J_015981 [Zea mays]
MILGLAFLPVPQPQVIYPPQPAALATPLNGDGQLRREKRTVGVLAFPFASLIDAQFSFLSFFFWETTQPGKLLTHQNIGMLAGPRLSCLYIIITTLRRGSKLKRHL